MITAGATSRRVRAVLEADAPTLRRWRHRLAAIWSVLRAVAGEDAYERYLEHRAAHHPGEPLMTRRDFCRAAEEARWSGVSRCC